MSYFIVVPHDTTPMGATTLMALHQYVYANKAYHHILLFMSETLYPTFRVV